jgi:TetR/AcrR family transcriptional regulator, lmrAB and yxaGH operons repressor
MIRTAARLFQRDGYHATSWRGLVEEAGSPWGSIHHHFPGGKTELGIAALEDGKVGVLALIDHCFAEQEDPATAVARWFELSGGRLVKTGYESGCPIATVALETLSGPDAVKNAARDAFASWESRLATHLRHAGLSRRRAADAAVSVLALLEGALLLSRVQADLRPMRIAGHQAEALISAAFESSAHAVG